ncbi:MAG: hypothetical protein J7M17_07210 [Anaerolineae bacterium]|nr:hypothetical protein [Anaerolineae bacterium]
MQKKILVPKKMRAKYDEIVKLTDDFCQVHLNDEYAELCRKMAAKLSRKRPSPLERGRVKSWAAAIIYTIGRINFLFDKTQTPHLKARQLCQLIGVSQNTASGKSTEIMRMFNLTQFDPDWTLPSRMDGNPLAWMISVNGLIVDARSAPREIQEEAFRLGLIPYLPD